MVIVFRIDDTKKGQLTIRRERLNFDWIVHRRISIKREIRIFIIRFLHSSTEVVFTAK